MDADRVQLPKAPKTPEKRKILYTYLYVLVIGTLLIAGYYMFIIRYINGLT